MLCSRVYWIACAVALVGCGGARAATQTTPELATGEPVASGVESSSETAAPTGQPAVAADSPCAADVRRQFDFWLGSWAVTNPKGLQVGSNRIELAQNGCVLVERWTSARGGRGMSQNFYSAKDKAWVQIWTDDQGGWLEMRGGLQQGAMVLQGEYIQADGSSYLLRGRWTPNADGTVRQFFESSKDGGSSWAVWFDGMYAPAAAADAG